MAKSIKCCVCGRELQFLDYAYKIGKDGRMAKWPVYEKCPNKANHSKNGRGLDELVADENKYAFSTVAEQEPVVKTAEQVRFRLYGLEPKELTTEGLRDILTSFEGVTGVKPQKARVNPGSLDKFKELFAAVLPDVEILADRRLGITNIRLGLDY